MVRSFLTRLVDSSARSILFAPCLLICLACATPFPIENLEEGMTTETVRENFGTPEAIETEPGGVESSWTYIHEELEPYPVTDQPMPGRVVVASIWGVPLLWWFAFVDLISDDLRLDCGHAMGRTLMAKCYLTGENWNQVWVSRAPVVLQFEGEKLVRWEVLPDIRNFDFGAGSGYSGFSQQSMFDDSKLERESRQRIEALEKDFKHHQYRGHKHHHVDHD